MRSGALGADRISGEQVEVGKEVSAETFSGVWREWNFSKWTGNPILEEKG